MAPARPGGLATLFPRPAQRAHRRHGEPPGLRDQRLAVHLRNRDTEALCDNSTSWRSAGVGAKSPVLHRVRSSGVKQRTGPPAITPSPLSPSAGNSQSSPFCIRLKPLPASTKRTACTSTCRSSASVSTNAAGDSRSATVNPCSTKASIGREASSRSTSAERHPTARPTWTPAFRVLAGLDPLGRFSFSTDASSLRMFGRTGQLLESEADASLST